jgi:YfiR/HmsC-like
MSKQSRAVRHLLRCVWRTAAVSTWIVALASGTRAASAPDTAPEVALKAAFLYNFAKFAEWPSLPSNAPIVLCVTGNEPIAAALAQTVLGQNVSGRALEVSRDRNDSDWPLCQLLFIADTEMRRTVPALNGIKALPVLTVSDGNGFADAGGMIELYVEEGRMRFTININATERSGLRLSSGLLGLAKVIRKGHVD